MSEMLLMIAGRNGLECICGRQGHRAALRKVRERYRKPKGRGAGVPQPFLFG